METKSAPRIVSLRRKQGIRTYVLLVLGMTVVTLIVTSLYVLIIRNRWRAQVTEDLSLDLEHSVTAFQDLQAERLGALEQRGRSHHPGRRSRILADQWHRSVCACRPTRPNRCGLYEEWNSHINSARWTEEPADLIRQAISH
jgi:hypothetical protein